MIFHYEPKFACSYCDYKTYKKDIKESKIMKTLMTRKNSKLFNTVL